MVAHPHGRSGLLREGGQLAVADVWSDLEPLDVAIKRDGIDPARSKGNLGQAGCDCRGV